MRRTPSIYAGELAKDRPLRIAVIDENPARAAVIYEGLHEAGLTDIVTLTERVGLVARLVAVSPDVILMDLANPSRDALEESFLISRSLNKPIAMFVDHSDEERTMAAVDAGVSAYVVDGLKAARIKPILELAIMRFHAFAKLQAELHDAKTQLAQRQAIDQAKRCLMRRRGISEPEAYKILRAHAMESNRRIVDIAEAIVIAEQIFKVEA